MAPRQSVPSEDSEGSTASHHGDPANGRKKGYTSLRRRRARVDAPPKDLQGITSRAKGNDDAESVSTPFSQFASEAGSDLIKPETKQAPETAVEKEPEVEPEKGPEPVESSSPVEVPVESVEPAKSETKSEESRPAEESGPKKFSAMPSFLSGGFAGMAFPGTTPKRETAARESEADVANASEGEGEQGKPATKRPIDLRRDRDRDLNKQTPSQAPAEKREAEEQVPPLDLEAGEQSEDEEKPPVLGEGNQPQSETASVEESREESSDDGAWPWLRQGSQEVEPGTPEPDSAVAAETEEEPPAAKTDEETPPPGDFEWLLSDDAVVPPGIGSSSERDEDEEAPARSQPEPMLDLETDLDELIGRRDDADAETPPPAPGPFPKWSSLEGSGLGELMGASRTDESTPPPATSHFPRDGKAEKPAEESPGVPPLDIDPWKKPEPASESPPAEVSAPSLEDPWKKPEPASESSSESESVVSREQPAAPPLDDSWAPPKQSVGTPDDAPPPLAESESKESQSEEPEHAIPVTLRPSRLREGDSQGSFGGPRPEGGSGLSLRLSEEKPPAEAREDGTEKPLGIAATPEPAPADPWKPSRELNLRSDDSTSESEATVPSAAPWLSPQSMSVAKQAPVEPSASEASPPAIEAEPAEPEAAEVPRETIEEPAAAPSASVSPPPIAKLPRFLDDSAARPGPESVPPAHENQSPAESGKPEPVSAGVSTDDGMPPLPASSETGSPPMLDMQAFGEGEPPRPGDRATAPGQQIRLPQVFDGVSDEKAVVSPITGEELTPFAPLEEKASGEQDNVSEKEPEKPAEEPDTKESDTEESRDGSPPASVSEPPVEKSDEAPSLKDFRIGDFGGLKAEKSTNDSRPLGDSGEDPISDSEQGELPRGPKSDDPGNFISERVKAATNSLSLHGEPEKTEAAEDSEKAGSGEPSSEMPPPVTPEVVSVPSSGHQDSGDGKAKSTPLDVETEEEEEGEGGPEDEGLAKVLGLLPRGKSAPARTEPAPASEPTPAPAPAKKKEKSTGEGGPALPSIDDVLAGKGRSHASDTDKGSWVEGIKNGLQTLDGRQKTIVIGGTAAAVLAVLLGIVGLAAGWFSGDSPQANPTEAPAQPVAGNDTGSAPEPPIAPGGNSAGATGTKPKPEDSAPPSPAPGAAPAGGGNKLVIVDPGAANSAPKTSQSNSTDPERVNSEESGSRQMTSLIPGGEGNLDQPADVASAVAWASGPPEKEEPGKPEPVDSIGAPEPVDAPDALVMPTVGAVGAVGAGTEVDPLVSDGTGSMGTDGSHFNYEEIGGIGEDGKAPTGAPVIPETITDPEVAMDRQENRVQSVAPIESAEDSAAAAAAASDGAKKPNLDDPLEASKFALEQFLAQSTWQKRLPYIYEADRLKPRIEAYYQTAKDGPITESVSKFFDMDENPADGGDPFYAFYLFLEGIETEFPVVVRKTADGYKVDWELFVECKDRLFLDFKNSEQSGPATFRFVMQRHSYWGPDRETFANSNDYICYKVEPPYPGAEAFVFVAKDSAVAAQTEKIATWGLPPVDVVLTLERVEFPHGVKHFVIKSLDKLSWVAP